MKTVLLVADVSGWAWWHMAQGIARYASVGCEVIDNQEFSQLLKTNPKLIGYEVVLQFGYAESHCPLPIRSATLLDHPGWMYPRGTDFLQTRLTTRLRNLEQTHRLKHFDTVLVKNRELHEFFQTQHPNVRRVTCGFDPQMFYPGEPPQNLKPVIGWCGQAERANQKGYTEILLPLMMKLGESVTWWINTCTAANPLTQDKMREWYTGLDLFLCTSCAEGGPMPPLEALACGRRVLSTNVGFIEELSIVPILPVAWSEESHCLRTVDAFAREIPEQLKIRNQVPDVSDRGWDYLADSWIEAIL